MPTQKLGVASLVALFLAVSGPHNAAASTNTPNSPSSQPAQTASNSPAAGSSSRPRPVYSGLISAAKNHINLGPVRRSIVAGPRLASQAGTNILVSYSGATNFSETAVSYDPTAHTNLEAGANDVTTSTPSPGGFYSPNSGAAWGISSPNRPTSPPNTFGGDPGIAYDGNGVVYYSFVSGNADASSIELVVESSTNKGVSWNAPVVADGPSPYVDKPFIAVDTNPLSVFFNRKYVGYDYANGSMLVTYSDNGTTWTKTTVYTSAIAATQIGAFPAVNSAGNVLLAWDDTGDVSGGRVIFAKSTNGGAQFGSRVVVATTTIGLGVTIPNWSTGRNPRNILATPSMDVDRTITTPTAGYIYMVWNDEQPAGGRMHVYFSRSTDGGSTWSSRVRLDTGNPNDAWTPTVAVDQLNGTVTVAWYDRRDDPNNKFYNVYYTQSTNGGVSFLPQQIRVTDAQSDPTLFYNATGDYMQMVAVDGTSHPVWADTRNSGLPAVSQIFTAAIRQSQYTAACFGLPMAGGWPEHTIAIRNSDGTAWGFGNTGNWELGYSTSPSDHSDVPLQTQGLPSGRVEAVSASDSTSFAIMPGGTVWQLGPTSAPFQVSGLSNVVAISQGSLALEGDGSVWTFSGSSATRVSGLPQIVKIAGAAATTAYALDNQGQVWAWGHNDVGQMGNGQINLSGNNPPQRVLAPKGSPSTYLSPVVNIAAPGLFNYDTRYGYALAVLSGGTVYAWGYNGVGELGNGTTKNSSLPVRSGSIVNAVDVAAATWTSAALLADGTVLTWGDNERGELGNGSVVNFTTSPVAVSMPVGTTFAAMTGAGPYSYFLAETPAGALWAWGNNQYGNLGIGPGVENNTYNSPVQSSMSAMPTPLLC